MLGCRSRRAARCGWQGSRASFAAGLDTLGLEPVDVLGYSFGGVLAQELAYRAPARVRRLVLCAPPPGWAVCPPKPMAALMLATPARNYHPRLLALSLVHIARGRARPEPSCWPRTPESACCTALAARLRLPALRRRRLVEPPVAAPHTRADAGSGAPEDPRDSITRTEIP